MTRLTIFIDPGRIKRGVLPLEDVRPALEADKRYSLVIASAWHDGTGRPLKQSVQQLLLVGPADREPPDPSWWRVQLPISGTQHSLVVMFPEPMDTALTQRVIQITDVSGKTVEGQIALTDQERRWSFNHLNRGKGVNINWWFTQRLTTLPGIASAHRSMWVYSKAFSGASLPQWLHCHCAFSNYCSVLRLTDRDL